VDLKGFEPLTSSMPFRPDQSLTEILRENKGLSGAGFGRQWTPRGDVWTFGLHADSRTPHRDGQMACLFAPPVPVRAVGKNCLTIKINLSPELPGPALKLLRSRQRR